MHPSNPPPPPPVVSAPPPPPVVQAPPPPPVLSDDGDGRASVWSLAFKLLGLGIGASLLIGSLLFGALSLWALAENEKAAQPIPETTDLEQP